MRNQKPTKAEVISLPRNLDELLIFDARFLDADTKRELLRLMPRLLHVRRLWKEEYVRSGCIRCGRKRTPYGAGGFCNACQARIDYRMRHRYQKIGVDRHIAEETGDLTRKFDAAQMLLNGDEA
jgi:hypothetical protein